MKIKIIMFTCLVAALLTASLIPVNAQEPKIAEAQNRDGCHHSSREDALLGAWKIRITPTTLPAFDEFMTFSDGGGIVESNNFPFFQINPAAGPGPGSWKYTGQNRFPFTFIKFLFTPQGAAAGTLKVTSVINYSPATDTWTSQATVVTCDTSVNNCQPLEITQAAATRIVAGL